MKTKSYLRTSVFVISVFYLIGLSFGCGGKPQVRSTERNIPSASEEKTAPLPTSNITPSKTEAAPQTRDETKDGMTDILKRTETEKTIEIEKNKVLAESYYQSALKLYQELKFGEAIDMLNKVLEVNPSHEKASVLLQEARLAQGEYVSGEMGAVSRKLFAEVRAKIQQAKLEVEYHLNKGIKYYKEEDYSKAEEEFKWVIESIKWFPYRADLMNYQTEAENYLRTTLKKKEVKERELSRRRETAARQLAAQEEEKRQEDFIKNIDMLFTQAQIEFEKENYQEATRLCEKILEKSPGNFVAEKLRTIALIANRSKIRKVNTETMVEEWKRTFESYDRKTVPYLDPITFPDKEIWEKIEHRGPKKIFKEKPVSELNKQAELLLKRKIKFPFIEPTPLIQIVQYIREIIPTLNIIIDNTTVEAQEPIAYNVIDIPLEFALKDMLSSKQWGFFIREGVVIISSLERIMNEEMETHWYNILDLTIPIVDFPSQEITLGMPADTAEAVQLPPIAGDQLIEIIKETTAKQEGGWDKVPPPTFQATTGVLVVTHLPAVHKQIESLLNQVRAATDVIVTIEGRFLRVQKTFLEDIGVDLRGLVPTLPAYFSTASPDGPGFTDLATGIVGSYRKGRQTLRARTQNFLTNSDPYARFIRDEGVSPVGGSFLSSTILGETSYRALLTAVQKDLRITEVFAPKITVANGQRAHIQLADQFIYTKDYDVVIVNAQSSLAMGKPVMDTFRTGILLDVRPLVSTDLKYVMMELRPSVASSSTRLPTIRTIPFLLSTTSLITFEPIELPELQIQRARGNAIIPDGGILLMACYTVGKDMQVSSNVPVLSKIPLLSFMLGSKAKGEGHRVLIILIKAKISILSEEEKRKF